MRSDLSRHTHRRRQCCKRMSRQRWFELVVLIKEKEKKEKQKKKAKEKGKTGKKTVRTAGENGAIETVIGQDSCSSKLQSSLRFISTLFPFTWFPLYTFALFLYYFDFNQLLLQISSFPHPYFITYFLSPWFPLRISLALRISHLPLYYVTEIIAPASHLSV